MNRRNVSHYVRKNHVTRIPRTFVYLDAEARRTEVAGGEIQTFRLACAALDQRHHHRDGWKDREWGNFDTTAGLWDWIDARCQPKARTVLVAHNLAYDLRITDGLRTLVGLGWELQRGRWDGGSVWATWRKGNRTLAMVDSLSWVPANLESLGQLCGIAKLPLPAWEDSDDAWRARCQRDVEILGEVWRRLMAWVRDDDLGNWKPTGAGQAWAAYRHRFMEHLVLVHENAAAREAERRAAWTGRCELWRHGRPGGGPFTEYDFASAYARIGAECDVPIKLVGEVNNCNAEQYERLTRKYAVLADVTVTTNVETVPARIADRMAWPVGTFQTTLWENEVAMARAHGATVNVDRAWWYRTAPAVASFCRWALGMIEDRAGEVDPIVALAVKQWSRSLIGRFGARWSSWETIGEMPTDNVAMGWCDDVSTGERYQLLQIGRQLQRCTAVTDSPDAVVSVMSWVMAEARVRLWGAMQAAGLDHVMYVDTDSVIVDRKGAQRLSDAAIPGLRVKGQWSGLDLLGPRQIVLEGRLRAAGIPRDSVRIDGTTFEGSVWSELSTSLAAGESDRVRITTRRVKLYGTDTRRDHVARGRTAPRVIDATVAESATG